MKMGMTLVTVVVALSLAVAPAATAQSSAVDGYGGAGNQVAGIAAGNDPGSGSGGNVSSSSSLPFTGLDVSLLVGGGLLLLGIGIVMTRVVPRQDQG